jgi:hypothetical protein
MVGGYENRGRNSSQEKIFALIEALLEFFSLNFGNAHSDSSLLTAQKQNPPASGLLAVGHIEVLAKLNLI